MAKILIIDDDAGIRALLFAVFSDMDKGHVVLTAPDGLKGVEVAKSEIPDAIVVDVDMPGLNGHEVCKQLRADPATRKISILMLTGTNDLAGAISGLGYGADDHITKPFIVDEVAARVQALLLTRD